MKFLKLLNKNLYYWMNFIIFESKTNYWINISLLQEHWAFRYKIYIFEWKKSYLNETAKGIEHKIQEKSKENRTIKYKQIRIEFCYTWVGILKVCLGYAYAFAMFLFRGGSRTAATSKMERFVIIVNGFQPLTIIIKCSILNVAAVLDPPLLLPTLT